MIHSRLVLLVEDNADDIELTRRAFEKSRVVLELIVVRDGAEALDYMFASGTHAARDPERTPSVVLLDLNLPKIDGHGVLERLRGDARTSRLPVVVLTSSKEERDLARSYDLGANSVVRKPVDFMQFLETARQVGQYWLSVNEPPPHAHVGETS